MNDANKIIRFDWAAKRILRDKANFAVLEGLLSVLFNEQVKIIEILESESNQNFLVDKFNRVDIKAKNSKDEIIIVEIQLTRKLYYLYRIVYGVSKAITEQLRLGEDYHNIKKIYSVNILYFDLGKGTDYLYHGTTQFIGVHTKDTLQVTTKENSVITFAAPKDVFPEYYIIRVNEFNKLATTPLEEWIAYLKTGQVKEDTTVPGLKEAKEKLQYLMMNEKDRKAYESYMDAVMVQNDVLDTARIDGRAEGRAEGFEEGRENERIKIAKSMKADGVPADTIVKYTGITIDKIEKL